MVVPAQRSGLVVVSTRLPVILDCGNGPCSVRQGDGGLVTALDPVLRARRGLWVGWPGVTGDLDDEARELVEQTAKRRGYRIAPVALDEALVRDFYGGFANAVLWPLFHMLDDQCVFDLAYWRAFQEANRLFAQAVHEHAGPDDLVWVHDYQLIAVAAELRKLDPNQRIGFFLHIPFPSLHTFLKLPWRGDVLQALLEYDLVGFQSERDRYSFLDCVVRLLPGVTVVKGEQAVPDEIRRDGRVTRVGTFPVGIDCEIVRRMAERSEVVEQAAALRQQLGNVDVLLGVDRLDYTKGIPERLLAFQQLLSTRADLHGRVVLMQVVAPSRELVPAYIELKQRIDGLVGAINGSFGTVDWVPVRYLYRSVGWPDLFALYRVAKVALVTPLKDGMNLVCKEYCVCQLDEPGVLVLSEFAGAASQLHEHAFVVNPYDVVGSAAALEQALALGSEERARRMERLQARIAEEDVHWWARAFLDAAGGGSELPQVDSYMPDLERESQRSGALDADLELRVVETVSRPGTFTSG
jgi:alpha,alpha-trehalose-phosphate synthase [UDP-forming]